MKITFNEEIAGALHFERPVVALESTVISHGLPHPRNLDTALRLEQIIREAGAIPATIAMFDGGIFAGLSQEQLNETCRSGLATLRKFLKTVSLAHDVQVTGFIPPDTHDNVNRNLFLLSLVIA